MELKDYREKMDAIDDQLLPLFLQRMEVAAEIAAWKKANGIPVLDAGRERAKLRELEEKTPEELKEILALKIRSARIPRMIVTMGAQGAVYADCTGERGVCPGRKVDVKDTTGAGDSFCAGLAVGLTYGKSLREACEIGTHLAASVIVTTENVCPRFLPRELGLDIDVAD